MDAVGMALAQMMRQNLVVLQRAIGLGERLVACVQREVAYGVIFKIIS